MYIPTLCLVLLDAACAASKRDTEILLTQWGASLTDVVGGPQGLVGTERRLRSGLPTVALVHGRDDSYVSELVKVAGRFHVPVVYVHDTDGPVRTTGAEYSIPKNTITGVLWGAGLRRLKDVDVIGDVHGQADALDDVLAALGYEGELGTDHFGHRDGRLPVFVGDLVDKGPANIPVLRSVLAGLRRGQCLAVKGNHEKGLAETLAKIAAELGERTGAQNWTLALRAAAAAAKPCRAVTLLELAEDAEGLAEGFATYRRMLHALPLLLELNDGHLVVVHAACKPEFIGYVPTSTRARREYESYLLYGPPRKKATAPKAPLEPAESIATDSNAVTFVRGHVTVSEAHLADGIVSIDTGAGDGTSLSAMRWPALEFVTVPIANKLAATAA